MKRLIFLGMIAAVAFTSCNKDEKVEVKDFGLKTFEADLNYDSQAAHGTIQYKQQTYFAFGDTLPVAVGAYGTGSWTDFFLMTDTSAYNVSTDVQGWDLLMTFYTDGLDDGTTIVPYGVVGVLLNTGNNVQVAKIEYTDSEDPTAISQAFADLTHNNAGMMTFSSEIDAIGYDWKAFSLSAMQYTVHNNWFYVVKVKNGDYYKLRFTSFYGTTTSQRVIKFEYQLMQ